MFVASAREIDNFTRFPAKTINERARSLCIIEPFGFRVFPVNRRDRPRTRVYGFVFFYDRVRFSIRSPTVPTDVGTFVSTVVWCPGAMG